MLIGVAEMVGELWSFIGLILRFFIFLPIPCLVIFSSSFVEDIVVGNAEIVLLVEVVDKSHSRDMMP